MLEADYLVVGAGAVGMGFTDALIDHADVRVALIDRREAPGGHWLAAYPFVRLHLASDLYGVASTPLGGRAQPSGPEAGMPERARKAEILAYYARVLANMEATGKVSFFPCCDVDDGPGFVSTITGQRYELTPTCRIVDTTHLSRGIPSESDRRFAVDADARAQVVTVNDLVRLAQPPERIVIVGSGKTAANAIVWLLTNGLEPHAITWVRPREPWMFDRAAVQPFPESYLGMNADIMEAAATAVSVDELFLRLEDAGVMVRIDRTLTPTMARTPTVGAWELELLRSVEDVIRLGHLRRVQNDRLTFDDGTVPIGPRTLIVDCAGEGMRGRPPVPIWQPDVIVPQVVQAGLPCFGAALVGYVEANRDDDADKNRLCVPSSYGNTLADWARMTMRGAQASIAFNADGDVRDWANSLPLNGGRFPPDHPGSSELDGIITRLQTHFSAGLANLEQFAGDNVNG